MILFPNAKINLGLNIIAKRPDGYHDLETVFYPIQLNDALEIINNPTHQSSSFIFSKSGNELEGSVESNLCYKAWALLKKIFLPCHPCLFICIKQSQWVPDLVADHLMRLLH